MTFFLEYNNGPQYDFHEINFLKKVQGNNKKSSLLEKYNHSSLDSSNGARKRTFEKTSKTKSIKNAAQ